MKLYTCILGLKYYAPGYVTRFEGSDPADVAGNFAIQLEIIMINFSVNSKHSCGSELGMIEIIMCAFVS